MPLQGHWQRVNTPIRSLTRRERLILRAVLAVALATAIALVIGIATASTPAPGRGCIAAFVPGATGGVLVSACGVRARRICHARMRDLDPGSRSIEHSCRRAGIA